MVTGLEIKTILGKGEFMANVMRGKGDMMGVASKLNDGADITAPVRSYWPNDYGLYQMAGNVSEWVMDVFRPLTLEDGNEFRAFRGNVFQTYQKDDDGYYVDKDSIGRMVKRPVTVKNDDDDLGNKRNYKRSDNISFLDGDFSSSVHFRNEAYKEKSKVSKLMYETAKHTLLSDRSRVYKGGSWRDRVFWQTPGARRHLDERQSTDFIGFRCAMHRVGSPKASME